jgi:hypothetical protein
MLQVVAYERSSNLLGVHLRRSHPMMLLPIVEAELGDNKIDCAMVSRPNSTAVSQSMLGPLSSNATASDWKSSEMGPEGTSLRRIIIHNTAHAARHVLALAMERHASCHIDDQ